MKKFYILLVIITSVLAGASCSDVMVGDARTASARYQPDTLDIKARLDPVKDSVRIKKHNPWVSGPIQGVQGTRPFTYKVVRISTESGTLPVNTLQQFHVRNDGTIEIACDHSLESGCYSLDIMITNVKESVIIEHIFTLHVLSAEEWERLYE